MLPSPADLFSFLLVFMSHHSTQAHGSVCTGIHLSADCLKLIKGVFRLSQYFNILFSRVFLRSNPNI